MIPAFFFILFVSTAVLPPADDVDDCLSFLPTTREDELPVSSLHEAQQSWTNERTVSSDTVRTYITKIQATRRCLRNLPASQTSAPLLEKILTSYRWEILLRTALRQFSEAFAAYDEALSLLNAPPSPAHSTEAVRTEWTTKFYQNRGYLHYVLGDLSSSIQSYVDAYEAIPASATGERVEQLLNIGILHQRTQDYRSARHYFTRAERHLRSSPSDLASEIRARLYHTQADLLLEQTLNEDFERDSLKQAAELARRGRTLAPPGSERYFRLTLGLSESLGYLGAFEEAYRFNDEVRRYARGSNEARLQTFALLKLGVLHMQTERWAPADSVLQKALAQAEALNDLDYQRRILWSLGRLHELRGHWAPAELFYRKGVEVVEEYRESLTASQWSTTAFAQWRDVHRGLVRALLAQDQPRKALMTLDRSRARHLQDLRTRARVSNQLPSEERARLDSLTQALTDVRNQLGEAASLSYDDKADLRNREASLMAARQRLLRLDSEPDRPSLDAISETLAREDRALVSYFLDAPWPVYDRSPRSVAFVLTGDSLRTIPLPGLTQDSLRSHVDAISPLLTSQSQPGRANAMHFDLRPLQNLYDLVYAPVADRLPAHRPLTIIPDGPLFHVPFSMLVGSMPGGRYTPSEAKYVLHERPTSVELASSLVAKPARWRTEWSQFEPKLAAYGVSEFGTVQSVPPVLRTALPEALSDSSLTLPSLPGVRQELQALQSTVSEARVSLNAQVSEQAFCRSARTAGVLHVASHAFVNATSPLQNAILLRSNGGEAAGPEPRSPSGTQVSGTNDGILFLHELQGQRTRIPMVVLSGCNTASGILRGGEGMEGLQYAFRAMGAQSTLSTLWPVADRASVELMDAFYAHLQDGHPKDVALQKAQLDYLEAHPQKASPFFWAPPVLYGSPMPLPLTSPFLPAWGWWVLGAAGLLLLAGGLLWWNRRRLPAPFCHVVTS